jgi:hypothetical protein
MRNSEKGDRYANLDVASHIRLNVFPAELCQAVIQDLKEELLVELSNLDLFLLNAVILEILEILQ